MTTSEANADRTWAPPALLTAADQHSAAEAQKEQLSEALETAQREGREAGYQAGMADAAEQVKSVNRLLAWLARPIEKAADELEQQILGLVADITRAVLRREISLEPAHLVGVIREALALLPQAQGEIEILVHPQDAELLESALAPTERETAWRLCADPLLGRGEFRVKSGAAEIDGSLETRLRNLLGDLGGERRHARQDQAPDESD